MTEEQIRIDQHTPHPLQLQSLEQEQLWGPLQVQVLPQLQPIVKYMYASCGLTLKRESWCGG